MADGLRGLEDREAGTHRERGWRESKGAIRGRSHFCMLQRPQELQGTKGITHTCAHTQTHTRIHGSTLRLHMEMSPY